MSKAKTQDRIEVVQRLERRIAQMQFRLEKGRRRVKERERKERDDRIFGLGRQAWIAGLLAVNDLALRGALLSAEALRADPVWRRKWQLEGEVATIDWEENGEKRARAADFKNRATSDIDRICRGRKHRWATLGGVIKAAGWAEENPEVLLGVLLHIKRGTARPQKLESWKQSGAAHVAAQEELRVQQRTTKRRGGKN